VHLYANADFDAPLTQPQLMQAGHLSHPIGAHSARGQDYRTAGIRLAIGGNAGHLAIAHQDVADLFRCVDHHTLVANMLCHSGYVIRQAVTAQVLLFDDQEVNTMLFGALADGLGGLHIGWINGAVHTKTIEYGFGFVNQHLCVFDGKKLGEVGFSQFVDVIQLSVRKEACAAHSAENIARFAALAVIIGFHGAFAPERGLALLDQQNPQVGVLTEIVGGKEAGRTGPDDDDIIMICGLLF
jgi:hypothetical protein